MNFGRNEFWQHWVWYACTHGFHLCKAQQRSNTMASTHFIFRIFIDLNIGHYFRTCSTHKWLIYVELLWSTWEPGWCVDDILNSLKAIHVNAAQKMTQTSWADDGCAMHKTSYLAMRGRQMRLARLPRWPRDVAILGYLRQTNPYLQSMGFTGKRFHPEKRFHHKKVSS